MVEHRWLRAVGPGVVALGAVVAIGSSTGSARERAWTPLACGPTAAARVAAIGDPKAVPPAGGDLGAWMRLDPTLDGDGALVGQRLAMGMGGGAARIMELPRESFAAGPFGRLLLVGADDGTASRLFTIDVATGCSAPVTEEADVIRRATIDPYGLAVFDSRVDRATRADLGVWRRPLDGSAPPARVLEPLGPDARFGRTWSTELSWSLEGDRLAVQSCGGTACRTRVLDPSSGGRPMRLVADPDLGPMVGLTATRLVTYDACRGLPCPVESVDVESGARTRLTDGAGLAVLVGSGPDARLVHETRAAAGWRLRSIAPDGRAVSDVGAIPTGLRLVPDAPRTGSATRLPPDWVLLSVDGRLPLGEAPGDPEPMLRHVPDGRSVQVKEATR